jgi:hypothetical protein
MMLSNPKLGPTNKKMVLQESGVAIGSMREELILTPSTPSTVGLSVILSSVDHKLFEFCQDCFGYPYRWS